MFHPISFDRELALEANPFSRHFEVIATFLGESAKSANEKVRDRGSRPDGLVPDGSPGPAHSHHASGRVKRNKQAERPTRWKLF